ncbi:hypothetical protein TNCV_719211 [Trichonephila clavipes]|nr:hypothetical protein TNCV_719211 [Trichonephila clavipes]
MAPLPENPVPLNEPETAPAPPRRKRNQNEIEDDDSGTFGFMDAIIELKKFFAENPSLIELGKQLRKPNPMKRLTFSIVTSQLTDNGYELSRPHYINLPRPHASSCLPIRREKLSLRPSKPTAWHIYFA